MNERDLLIQRYCDGELDAETAAGVKRLIEQDPQVAQQVELLDRFSAALSKPQSRTSDADLVQTALRRLGHSRPLRSVQSSSATAGSIIVVISAAVAVGLMLSIQNDLSAFLPMAGIATILLGIGILAILLANPLRSIEKSILGKIMRRRLTVAPAEILSYRMAGLIVAIGAIWMLLSQ